jgi:uncharacterized protein (TIGR02186 family)
MPAFACWVRMAAPLVALAILIWPARTGAEDLIFDWSPHRIQITSDFTGAQVLVYGVVDGPGDVIIVIHGPTDSVDVRRKRRFAGIWINRDKVTFDDVPAFYAIAASAPLDKLLGADIRQQRQLGIDSLQILTADSDVSAADADVFRQALIERRQTAGLYSREPGSVRFVGAQPRLFRTNFVFPASVPIGSYRIETLLVRDGAIAKAQTIALPLSQEGRVADVTLWAHEQAPAYGLVAILLSLLSGWAAHLVFRRL